MKRILLLLCLLSLPVLGQVPYQLSPSPYFQFFDSTGVPLAGGKVCTFQAGTTTPLASYADNIGTPNSNPIVLDAAGRATIYLGAVNYKIAVYDATGDLNCPNSGSLVRSQDNVTTYLGNLVDNFSNQTIGGNKTFSGLTTFTGQSQFSNLAIFGTGATAAPGIFPRWLSVQDGSGSSPVTTMTSSTPSAQMSLYDSTPATIAGFNSYNMRMTRTTGSGLDDQSGAVLGVFAVSNGTNVIGIPSETAQVGIISNCTTAAGSDAQCVSINAIVNSQNTVARAQSVGGVETDMASTRAPKHFGDATGTYGVGYSAVVAGVSPSSMTRAFDADSSAGGLGWMDGIVCSSCINFAFGAFRNSTTPDTGLWVGAAATFGIYVGAKALYPLNPGEAQAFDANHNPAIGIALGERAATTGDSNILRYISTTGGSVESFWDESFDASLVHHYKVNGTDTGTWSTGGLSIKQGNLGLTGGKGQHFVTQAASNDMVGSGVSPFSVVFTTPYANTPICELYDASAAPAVVAISAYTAAGFTATGTAGHTINYICVGNPN